MSYNIAVCIKPVPDPDFYDKITIDPRTKRITRSGIPAVINPADKNAVEAALEIKEKYGGKVTVITMAPPNAEENMREVLAMGADAAYILSDREFGGADTLATSYTLAQGLKKIGPFDIIITGTESADGATTQVPAQLAQWLEIPHLWGVKKIEFINETELKVRAKIEGGSIEYVIKLPALLAVSREINRPRYTTIMGIKGAKKKPLTIYGVKDIDIDLNNIGLKGSPTQAGAVNVPSIDRKCKKLRGEPDEIADLLIRELTAAGIPLE